LDRTVAVPAPNDRPDAALAQRCRRKDNSLFEESEAIILVVEDDEEVRTLMKATLEDLNYQVITMTDGPSALKILHSDQHIDLLFTDIVMPGGMSGLQLAEHARDCRPELPVLLTFGYNEEFTGAGPVFGADLPLIRKPFRRRQLAEAITGLLAPV
jgi:CheY-like chemotaxis protein